MNTQGQIEHLGRIISVDNQILTVSVIAQAACSSCAVKGSCSVGEAEEKIVEVRNPGNRDFQPGQIVTVVMDKGKGGLAVVLGYFIPFLILLTTLLVMQGLGYSEGISGITAILMLVPYYLILYLSRKKYESRFEFRIK